MFKIFVKPISITSYKLYRFTKKELAKLKIPAGQRFLYPLANKYFLHLIVVVLSFLVVTNSLGAREIKLEEFGQETLFSSLVSPDFIEEIVEGIETISPQKQYQSHSGTLKSSLALEHDSGEIKIATADEGAALVKATIPDTSATGTPREKVELYQVKGGDTISTIAGRFGISTNTILWSNDLSASSTIKPGQSLSIPPVSGVLYKVKSGDTMASIVKKYKVDEGRVLEYNQLADATAIEAGQQIMLPGGEIEPPPPPTPTTSTFASVFSGSAPPSARASAGERLQWPTNGRKISQYYRWGHQAIDISGSYSSPIYAAEAGTVSKAGTGRGYGNVIYINHAGGKQTIYAHLSKFFVQQGQQVSKGQTIAIMGCTGWCTGTHLHFEVVVGGSKQNPLSYL